MNKKALSVLFFLNVSLLVFSQTAPGIDWQTILGGNGFEKAKCVKPTADGGFVVVGWTISDSNYVTGAHGNPDDVWVVKLDKEGKKQWDKAYGGSDYDDGNYIQQTKDGGYIVVGTTFSRDGDVTGLHQAQDIWVLKLDSMGALQWQKCYGGSDMDYGNSIQLTQDGGYIIAGYTRSDNGDITGFHGGEDYWILKLSDKGVIEWQKCYGGNYSDVANDIDATPDGGYIVVGQTNSLDGDVTAKHRDISHGDSWVVKLSKEGAVEWQKCYGGSLDEKCNSVKVIKNGYILAGTTSSNDDDVSGNHGNQDYWVVMINMAGDLIWQKCYGGSSYDQANAILPLKDLGFVIAGASLSYNGEISASNGDYDAWVVKIDSVGKLQWQKSIGTAFSDDATSICVTNDLGYVIAGSINASLFGYRQTTHYLVAKLKTDALLPLSLISFNGLVKNNTSYLTWQTASEQNSLNFIIQRNAGLGFENVGIVSANGTTKAIKNYSFDDNLAGINNSVAYVYYRLQQNDKNGHNNYSNIIRLQLNKTNNQYVWPNPAKNIITAYIPNYEGKLQVEIYSATGQKVQSAIGAVSNNNTIKVNVAGLPAATYFFTAIINGKPLQYKFIKQ